MTDIDALTAQLDALVKNIDKAIDAEVVRKRKQTFHLEHDDGNGNNYDDVSNPSMAADDDSDGDGDGDGDGYNPGAGSEVTLGDDDDEDDDGVTKYQQEETAAYAQRNDSTHRPGSLETSDHVSSSNARHRFLALVAAIKNDQGIPATTAMAYARQKDPTGYLAFQGRSVTKSARSLLQQEMAKGVTEEIAKQRLVNLYGASALDEQSRAMSKAEATAVTAENELLKRAGALWEDDPALSRTDALRKARQDHPALYRRMTR
jgi:hypothetical protein